MRKLAKLALFMIIALLMACGGDTGFVGSDVPKNQDDPPDDGPAVARVTLLAGSTQLQSGDGTGVEIMAIVRDENNVLLADQPVEFAIDTASDAALTITQLITDDTGTARAVLTTGGNEQNRTITVNAISSDISDSLAIDVVGTALTIAGTEAMVSGDTATLTLTLQDSFGKGLTGEVFSISSSSGNTLSATTLTADASGQAQVQVTAVNSGTDNITVTALGETQVHTLNVTSDTFALSIADPEAALNVPHTVNLQWEINGVGQNGTVLLSTTRGTLNVSSIAVVNGAASFTVTSANAGPALISASVSGGGTSTTLDIEFVATTPERLELQTDKSTVGIGDQATLTATVYDALVDGNRVKNQRIIFSIVDDTSGGNISTGAGLTDSQGQISTVFTAGSSTTALNGVTISATVENSVPLVTDQVSFTVGKRAAFVSLGTGNEIAEPDPTKYSKQYSVLVTDGTGGPVPNTEVSLSVVPLRYFKGWYTWNGLSWQPNFPVALPNGCVNEDIDGDAQLGPTEDINGNGVLDPGNVVAVVPGTVTTDETGFALFEVQYAQTMANWVQVSLEARTLVEGTETTDTVQFVLTGSAKDFNSEDSAPPSTDWPNGSGSPFGIGEAALGDDTCATPN